MKTIRVFVIPIRTPHIIFELVNISTMFCSAVPVTVPLSLLVAFLFESKCTYMIVKPIICCTIYVDNFPNDTYVFLYYNCIEFKATLYFINALGRTQL